jgi:Lipopolysaccharide kinase (Kdo/WaaP) family
MVDQELPAARRRSPTRLAFQVVASWCWWSASSGSALRAAGIAHRDLGLSSVLLDGHGRAWLVDFDRAEAAADERLLDRDVATLLTALDGMADPALTRATVDQTFGQDLEHAPR